MLILIGLTVCEPFLILLGLFKLTFYPDCFHYPESELVTIYNMIESVLVVIAVVLRILSNPLGNVFQKQLTGEGVNPLVVNFSSYFLLAVVCGVFILILPIPKLPSAFWIYSILGGIVGAAGNGFLVKALQLGDLSVLGPVNSYKSVVAMLVGILLLGEIPSIWGLFGIALIIYGSYFVLDTTDEKFSWKLFRKKEIQFRIWAMILTAIEAVFIKKIILVSSTEIAFMSWCIFGALFSFFLLFVNRINLNREFKTVIHVGHPAKYLFLILCIGTMQFTTNYALDHIPVGYALSLFQLSIVVSVLLGYKIFSEQNIKRKIIGSLIMIVGSVILIALKN